MHKNCMLLFNNYAKSLFEDGMKILEIGPNRSMTFKNSVQNTTIVWHTLDITDDENLTYPSCEEYSFPVPDETYDIVLSGQVIEHVKKPWKWVPELARITKKNGYVITINPVSWPYHEAPVDCWRIYPEGMKSLYEEANLTPVLSKFESMETPNYQRYRPGMTLDTKPKTLQLIQKLLARFGCPLERSYDTITIGKKI